MGGLVDEQPLAGRGDRDLSRSRLGPVGGVLGAGGRGDPALGAAGGGRLGGSPTGLVAPRRLDERGEAPHGRRVEDGPERERHAPFGVQLGGEPGRADRGQTGGEEVVVRGGFGDAEGPRDEGGEGCLVGARPLRGTGRGRPGAPYGVGGWRGDGAAVDLEVGGAGEVVDHLEHRRAHVGREQFGEALADPVRQLGAVPRRSGRPDPQHETGPARGQGPHDGGGLGDAVDERGHRLELTGLDSVAVDLDLGVDAAEYPQHAVLAETREIARAIEPSGTEGIGDEAPRGEGGPSEVAVRQLLSTDVEFARRAGGDRHQPGVQDAEHRAGIRTTGIWSAVRRPGVVDRAGGDPHRRLGRSVEVDDLAAAAHEAGREPGGQGLAADEGGQRGDVDARVVDERRPLRGSRLQSGDAVRGGEGAESDRIGGLVVPGDDRRPAVRGHGEQFEQRDVEAEGGDGEQHGVGVEAGRSRDRVDEARERPPGDDDALGAAGRTGGVEHVRGGGRGPLSRRCLGYGPVGRECVDVHRGRRRPGGVGDRPGQGPAGDDAPRTRVLEHRAQARDRVRGVERNEGGAGVQHRHQCDDGVDGAGQREADAVARPHVLGAQRGGQPEGAVGQFRAGEPAVPGDHREGVGSLGGAGSECVDDVGRGPGGTVGDTRPHVERGGDERRLGIADERLERARHGAGQAGDLLGDVPLGVAVDADTERSPGSRLDRHRQVAHGADLLGGDLDGLPGHPGEERKGLDVDHRARVALPRPAGTEPSRDRLAAGCGVCGALGERLVGEGGEPRPTRLGGDAHPDGQGRRDRGDVGGQRAAEAPLDRKREDQVLAVPRAEGRDRAEDDVGPREPGVGGGRAKRAAGLRVEVDVRGVQVAGDHRDRGVRISRGRERGGVGQPVLPPVEVRRPRIDQVGLGLGGDPLRDRRERGLQRPGLTKGRLVAAARRGRGRPAGALVQYPGEPLPQQGEARRVEYGVVRRDGRPGPAVGGGRDDGGAERLTRSHRGDRRQRARGHTDAVRADLDGEHAARLGEPGAEDGLGGEQRVEGLDDLLDACRGAERGGLTDLERVGVGGERFGPPQRLLGPGGAHRGAGHAFGTVHCA